MNHSAGDAPRSRRVLRVIALERAVRGMLLLAAAVYLVDPRRPFFHRIIVRLHALHAGTIVLTGIAALLYGLLELVEGVGLWLDQLWAEYLTVIATSLLIPVELYELVRKPSVLKAGGILVNVAIVAFLAWLLRRRLARTASS